MSKYKGEYTGGHVIFPMQNMRLKFSVATIPWASYQIRKIARCACPERFPCHRQRKPLVSYPGMHHGTYATHVSWRMSGSLTRGGGENVRGIPGPCTTHNFTYLTRGPLVSYTKTISPPQVYFPGNHLMKRTRLEKWTCHIIGNMYIPDYIVS